MATALLTAALAQLLDLGTFVSMVARRGVGAEGNPVVGALYDAGGLLAVGLAKVALIAFVAYVAARVGRRAGRLVVMAAIVAGLVGGLSNLRALVG